MGIKLPSFCLYEQCVKSKSVTNLAEGAEGAIEQPGGPMSIEVHPLLDGVAHINMNADVGIPANLAAGGGGGGGMAAGGHDQSPGLIRAHGMNNVNHNNFSGSP